LIRPSWLGKTGKSECPRDVSLLGAVQRFNFQAGQDKGCLPEKPQNRRFLDELWYYDSG
jgi:hypothetical protein